MPQDTKIYVVKAPDGQIIRLKGPIGASQDEVMEQAQALYKPNPERIATLDAQAKKYPTVAEGGNVSPSPVGKYFHPPDDRDLSATGTASNALRTAASSPGAPGILSAILQYVQGGPSVASQGATNMLNLGPKMLTAAPGAIAGLAKSQLVDDPLTAQQKLGEAAYSTVKPGITVMRGAVSGRSASIPGLTGPVQFPEYPEGNPDDPLWKEAQGAAFAGLLGIPAGEAAGAIIGKGPRAVVNALTSPDSLMLRAAKLKTPVTPGWIAKTADFVAERATGLKPGKATSEGFRAARATAYENISKWAAAKDAAKQFANPPTPEAFPVETPTEPFFPNRTGRRPATQINNPPQSVTPENLPPQPTEAPRTPAPYQQPETQALDIQRFLAEQRAPKPEVSPFKAIEEAIQPSGRYAKQASQLVDAKGVPTNYGRQLIAEVPEIVGKPKGPQFDTALVDGLRRTEQRVSNVEDAIPDTTIVPQEPIVQKLTDLAKQYDEVANPKTAAILERLLEQWKSKPAQIPWKEFLKSKRSFFKEANTRSIPMRRAYGILMDASGEISPALSEANKSYSVVRRAIDNANIDIKTGRRIMEVGKPPKE